MKHLFCLMPLLLCTSYCIGQQIPIQAELNKKSAWTGEKVTLIITLYSPGPFSGTPSFDLPELSRTAILKIGNPVVGTEELDDQSYITQRHEFAIYTQRSGKIIIPSFQVRYAGKKDFTSDPVARESTVPELSFNSQRPPNTDSMGIVVSATEMQIQQTWDPSQTNALTAGDVIQRIITRQAEGTTAMMFPPIPETVLDGIRVYPSSPEVQDKLERGQSSAIRKETLKYQFEKTGSFSLPDLEFHWWNPQKESLENKTLPGLTIEVTESASSKQLADTRSLASSDYLSISTKLIAGALLAGLTLLFAWKLKLLWNLHQLRPDVHAAAELRRACNSNNPRAAYAALLLWFDATEHFGLANVRNEIATNNQYSKLNQQWQNLAKHLFARDSKNMDWNPEQLWSAFKHSKKTLGKKPHHKHGIALPPLNPTSSIS